MGLETNDRVWPQAQLDKLGLVETARVIEDDRLKPEEIALKNRGYVCINEGFNATYQKAALNVLRSNGYDADQVTFPSHDMVYSRLWVLK